MNLRTEVETLRQYCLFLNESDTCLTSPRMQGRACVYETPHRPRREIALLPLSKNRIVVARWLPQVLVLDRKVESNCQAEDHELRRSGTFRYHVSNRVRKQRSSNYARQVFQDTF